MCSPCSVNAPCHAVTQNRGQIVGAAHIATCRGPVSHVPPRGMRCHVCMRCACGVHALSVLCACRVHAMRIPCAGYAFCYVREVHVGVCELAGGSCVINNNTAFRVRVQSVLCECRRTPCCAASRSGLRVCRTCRGRARGRIPPECAVDVCMRCMCMRCACGVPCVVRVVCVPCARGAHAVCVRARLTKVRILGFER